MKKCILCLFLLALGGEIRAQVTCDNCTFTLSGGTQVLVGDNLIAGATEVFAGTIKLQGNGQLSSANAGDAYEGLLDIANTSAGTTPAVFEHNGDKKQVFAGNITNSGSGNILGAFIQSGSGKTIITGAKDFGGTVNVTGGFFGGSGNLSKTKSVTVAEGSIGGGLGVEANGATLTVSGLNFSSAASKLVVTSLSATDNTPSLLEVKTAGLPSPITAANNFTVSLVGANLASGYILKCSNGVSDRLPLPTLVGDLAERSCLAWDGTGLFLRVSAGSITLTTTTVCPRGVNSTNSQIIITAQYGDAHDYLPQGAIGTFSLSDATVKNGDITTTRASNATVTASFDGANATTTELPYKVTYSDEKNCGATLETKINPQPALSVSSGGNPNCKGTPIVLQAVGHGAVTISPANADQATVTPNTTPTLSATATALVVGNVTFLATDNAGCKSEFLSVAVKDIPTMKPVAAGDALAVCKGQAQPPIPLVSEGAGDAKADAYNWQLKNGNTIYDVGLADYTTQPPTETSIPSFTPLNSTTSLQSRDVIVTPFNRSSGCYGAPKELKITVGLIPVISLDNALLKACSGETITTLITKSAAGSWLTTDVGGTSNGIGTTISPEGSITVGAVASEQAVLQDISLQSDNCISNSIRLTINPKPIVSLTDPNFIICGSMSNVKVPLHTGNGLLAATGYKWKQNGDGLSDVGLADKTDDWSAGTDLIISATPPTTSTATRGMIITPYNSTTGCAGSDYVWKITLNPALTISLDNALLKTCSGEAIPTLITKSATGSWLTTDVGGTSNGIGTTISPEGSITAGTVASEQAVLQDISLQSDNCISNSIRLTINPKPIVSLTDPNFIICGNMPNVRIPLNTGNGLLAATGYKWKQNGDGLSDVGLADKTDTWSDEVNFTTPVATAVLTRGMILTPYNSTTGCAGSDYVWKITVKPNPVISANTNLSKLCSGLSYANALAGEAGSWAVYKTATAEVGLSVINATATTISIQAGIVTAATVEDVVLTSASSCKSKISLTIYPKPILPEIQDMVYCGNAQVSVFIPAPNGEAEIKPTHYQWKLAANPVNSSDIGLSDYTADWTKNAISFTTSEPPNGTTAKRDIVITGYNQTSGCATEPQDVTLSVIQGLALSFDALSPICSGTEATVLLTSSLPDTKYKWTVNNNSAGAQGQDEASASPTIRQLLANTGPSSETVTYTITGTSGSCTDIVSIPIEVSASPMPTAPLITGGGEFCVNPENNTYQTNLIPTAAITEWTYTSYLEGQENNIAGNTQNRVKSSLPAVNDNLVLTGDEPSLVYYVFRPYSGCFGTPSQPIGVKVYPTPVAASPNTSYVCGSSEAHPTTADISLTDLSTPDVAYTWTVDNANAPHVSGYSQPSREGALVGSQNPAAASSLIADPLLIATTTEAQAAGMQTLDYWITPWRKGCSGKAVKGSAVVYPLPVVRPPADRRHCASVSVEAETLEGTNGPNKFKWSGGNAVNLSDQLNFDSGSLPRYTTPAEDTPPALVTITAKNANGCESAPASFTILVIPKPTLAITPIAPTGSRALCTGATIGKAAAITLGITPNPAETTYTWTASFRENSGTRNSQLKIIKNNLDFVLPYSEISNQTGDLSATFTALDGDDAQIIFSMTPVVNNCQGNIVKAEVNVRGKDLMSGARMDNMTSNICSGNATAIKVGGEGDANTYRWKSIEHSDNVQVTNHSEPGRALSDEHGENTTLISEVLTLKDNKPGNITYVVTPSRDDCDGLATRYRVPVNPVPTISVSPDKAFLCSGQKTNITLATDLLEPESKDIVYAWQVSDNTMGAQSSGEQTNFEQQLLTNPNATDGSVTYTFTPSYISPDKKGSCQGQSVAVTYTVTSSAVAHINEIPEKVCLGDNITLKATPDDAHYQWLKNGVEMAGAVGSSFVAPTDEETTSSYAVRITSACGSAVSEPRIVRVTADAYFIGGTAAMDKIEEEIGKTVGFSYTGPDADYTWDFNNNTTATTKNTSHSYTKADTYHPVLKAVKSGQPNCQKTFFLPNLKIKEALSDNNQNDLSVFPNAFPLPANTVLTIENDNDMQSLSIINISGQTVARHGLHGRKATLSVTDFASGVYLLLVTDSYGVKPLKIIIVHAD